MIKNFQLLIHQVLDSVELNEKNFRDRGSGFVIKQNTYSYETNNDTITINIPNYRRLSINRKSLKLSRYTKCELVDRSVDLKSKMRKIYDSIKKSETSENKI